MSDFARPINDTLRHIGGGVFIDLASDNQGIANTMTDLKTDGLIDYPEPQPGFPWSKARVTEAGLKLLEHEHG